MTYERGGPQYKIEEPYLAPWHRDKVIELLDESYEALLEFAADQENRIPSGDREKVENR